MFSIRRILRKWEEHTYPAVAQAMEADAGFDAGEWSASARDRAWQARENRVERQLLAHYGQWVTAYEVELCYGGPEEGGWWYRAGTVIESLHAANDEDVEHLKIYFRMMYGDRFSGRPLSSVLSDGELQIRVSDGPGLDFPAERPHYE